jgi:hypothetical protein
MSEVGPECSIEGSVPHGYFVVELASFILATGRVLEDVVAM